MQLYLGGHLNWYDSQKRRSFTVVLEKSTPLTDVLIRVNVPLHEVAICIVNTKAVFSLDKVILNDDNKVDLYPFVDGG